MDKMTLHESFGENKLFCLIVLCLNCKCVHRILLVGLLSVSNHLINTFS